MANDYAICPYGIGIGVSNDVGVNTSITLSTQLVYGTSGTALGWRFCAPYGATSISSVLVYCTTAPGTANDLTCLACATTSYIRPGTQLTNGSKTVTGGTTSNKWIKFTFDTPPSVTAGTMYWIVVGDATAAPGSYQIQSRNTGPRVTNNLSYILKCYTSTVGFSTDGTTASDPPSIMINFNNTSLGSVYNGATADGTDNERGLKIEGLTEQLTICGINFYESQNELDSLKIYEGNSTLPGGTIYSGFNGGSALSLSDSQANAGIVMFAPCTLQKETVYRIVFDYSGSDNLPGYYYVLDPTTDATSVAACCIAKNKIYRTVETTGPAWIDYNNSTNGFYFTRMALIVSDQVAIAAGGGGLPILGGSVVR